VTALELDHHILAAETVAGRRTLGGSVGQIYHRTALFHLALLFPTLLPRHAIIALGDDATIPVVCPSCGAKTELEVRWLKAVDHFICSCSTRVEVDADKLVKAHERIERQIKAMFDEFMKRR
jgi:hypothetical protein